MKSQQSTLSTPPEQGARDRLLKVAVRLFTQKGYATTSVNEIVEAAGVAKPSLYYYFKSKEGLYLAILQEAFATFEAVVEEELSRKGSARERVIHFTQTIYDLFVEKLDVVRLLHSVYYGPPQGAPFFDFDRYKDQHLKVLQRLVDEGVRAGEFAGGAVDDIAWLIAGVFEMATNLELAHPELRIGREGLARLLDLLMLGIGPKGAQGKERQP